MTFLRLFHVFSFIFLSLGPVVHADGDVDPKDLMKVHFGGLQSGGQNYLVITLRHAPHWHTYWKNPGDAGLPTVFEFKSQQKKIELPPSEWPAPKTYYDQGNLLAYGYGGEPSYFFRIPTAYKNSKIEVKTKWLICKNICIPGQIVKEIQLENSRPQLKNPYEVAASELKARFESLPKKSPEIEKDFKISLHYNSEKSGFELKLESTRNPPAKGNWVYPFPQEPFDWKHEKLTKSSSGNSSIIPSDWDGEYMEPEYPIPTNGKFKEPVRLNFLIDDSQSGKFILIQKEFSEIAPALSIKKKQVSDTPNNGSKIENSVSQSPSQNQTEGQPLLLILLFAFIGGVILNIMPCVLPVISLKLFGLIKHSNADRSKILKHNLFYTLGVQIAFVILSIVVVGLKSSGQSIGWGFHLQNPYFVGVVAMVLFTMALNFFGLFEFNTPGGRKLGNIQMGEGHAADVFNGLLATLLSTPCSAPFLGSALTYAFTTTNLNVFLIFLSVGFGLSFPFILTGLFPQALAILPKPGLWMDKFKKLMGLPLLLTAIWLIDVIQGQSPNLILYLNLNLVLIFFALYASKNLFQSTAGKMASYFLLIIGLMVFFQTPVQQVNGGNQASAEKNWEPWSESKMMEATNRWVFVDFTARWCFTCKVNKKVVIQTDAFDQLTQKYNIQLMVADWTNYDPVIGDWLKKQGLAGVPAYFLKSPDGVLHSLGETLSLSEIEEKLKSVN